MYFPVLRFLAAVLITALGLSAPAQASGGFSFKGGSSFSSSANRFLPVDEAFVFSSSIEPGVLKLHWDIADGYYLYRDRMQVSALQSGVVLEDLRFSKPGESKEDPYFGLVEVFYDEITLEVPIISTGNAQELQFRVSYQGCADAGLCYPPQTKEALYLASTSTDSSSSTTTRTDQATLPPNDGSPAQGTLATQSAKPSAAVDTSSAQSLAGFIQDAGLWQILGLFFLLGIGLAFTPCVFPMIPILSSIIAGQKQSTTGSSFVLSLAYVLGVASLYALLGFVVGFFGAGANLQAYLQDPWILSLFAAVFVLLALSMFGFYEIQLPAFLRDRLGQVQQKQSGGTLLGVFTMGLVSALVVSPCVSAPLAGSLFYIATTGDATFGAMVLFTLALGMGIPLLIIGTGAGRFLPRAGGWMVAIKGVFGVMLLAVAIWLLERFLAGPITLALWASLAGISAVYLGAFEPVRSQWHRLWKGAGLLLFVYAVLLLIGAASGASDPLRPLTQLSLAGTPGSLSSPLQFTRAHNLEQLEQQVQNAAAAGSPVMVDVYADWCISCKIMERDTFPHPQVRPHLEQMHLIKMDVTANDQGNQEFLRRFGLFGPPGLLFYDQSGQELEDWRIYGEISTTDFIRHLEQIPVRG